MLWIRWVLHRKTYQMVDHFRKHEEPILIYYRRLSGFIFFFGQLSGFMNAAYVFWANSRDSLQLFSLVGCSKMYDIFFRSNRVLDYCLIDGAFTCLRLQSSLQQVMIDELFLTDWCSLTLLYIVASYLACSVLEVSATTL